MVLDIFAGSNTTGAAAESLGRRWIAFELEQSYLAASAFRFLGRLDEELITSLYARLTAINASGVTIPQIPLQDALFEGVASA
jgi:site-specific DNA-methyltransferase (cytosine-N4-specific)